jgi:hypothetical protein
MIMGSMELVAYGERSHFVTSVRIAHPMGFRPSPDAFGKVHHLASPLQDSVGVITPSSLHYVATTGGHAFVVPARGGEAAFLAAVGLDAHQRLAVSERAKHRAWRSQEAGAGIVGLN